MYCLLFLSTARCTELRGNHSNWPKSSMFASQYYDRSAAAKQGPGRLLPARGARHRPTPLTDTRSASSNLEQVFLGVFHRPPRPAGGKGHDHRIIQVLILWRSSSPNTCQGRATQSKLQPEGRRNSAAGRSKPCWEMFLVQRVIIFYKEHRV